MSIRPTSPQGPPDQPGESPFSLFGDELSNPPAGVLRSRLVETAFSRALLDVTYWTHDSPVGALFLAATDAGVCRLAFTQENHDGVLEDLANSVSPRMMRDPRRFDIVVRQLDEYFEQRRQRFDVSLDLRLLKGFRRTAIDHLGDIEYGSTASYAELARISGNPRAVRAAASACSHNPLPLLLPCHRVVRSDGGATRWSCEPAPVDVGPRKP